MHLEDIPSGQQLQLAQRSIPNLLGVRDVVVPDSAVLIDAAIVGQRLDLWFAFVPGDTSEVHRRLHLVPIRSDARTPLRSGRLRFVRVVDAGGLAMLIFEEIGDTDQADVDDVQVNA